MGDYAIWNETAEFARGNRPDFLSKSLNAAALVRLDVDTFLVLDRNLDTRASLALDSSAAQEYEIPPDAEFLAAMKQAVTSGQLNTNNDSLSGIVQRARGPALFAVRPIFDSTGTGHRMAGSHSRALSRHSRGTHGSFLAVAGLRLSGREPGSRRLPG